MVFIVAALIYYDGTCSLTALVRISLIFAFSGSFAVLTGT